MAFQACNQGEIYEIHLYYYDIESTAYNASSGTEVDGFNCHHGVGIVVQETYELLQQPETADAALQAAGSALRAFILTLLQSIKNNQH